MKSCAICVSALLALTLGGGPVHGGECRGVSFPEQLQSDGDTLTLNGLGLRQATVLKVDVYIAALYVTEPSGDADVIIDASTPKELRLHFVRDVDRDDLEKAWDEGFERNAKGQLAVLEERISAFKGLMTDMKAGQQMHFVHRPGAGTRVAIDGTRRGVIAGDEFARALFAIWFGGHPPNADLKAGLLGGECG